MLARYGRPSCHGPSSPTTGRPAPAAAAIFHSWAQLPIGQEEYTLEQAELQRKLSRSSRAVPGVVGRRSLNAAKKTKEGAKEGEKRSSCNEARIQLISKLKTDHLGHLFTVFESRKRRVLGMIKIAVGRVSQHQIFICLRWTWSTIIRSQG